MLAARMGARNREIALTFSARFDLAFVLGGAAAAAAIGILITTPELHTIWEAAVVALVLVTMLLIPPNAFLASSFLFFGLLQLTATRSFSVGAATVFPSDLFVGLVAIRAFSPRDRIEIPRRLHAFTLSAVGLWVALMVLGMVRGRAHGAQLDEVVRGGLALFYWPILYVGFSRVLRERGVDFGRLLRVIVAIGLGLTLYMFLMRLLNRPFESTSPGIGHLGQVETSTGHVFHRDFGFWSAYIVYPIIALIALGKLVYTRNRALAWLVIASVSIIATLTTLIRSEIYGLIAGIAVVLLFSTKARDTRIGGSPSRRLAALVMVGSVMVGGAAALAAVSPAFARAIGERSIPHVGRESPTAQENAEYRLQALTTGTSVAGNHLLGLGILSAAQLDEHGIDTGFLAHSGPATLLIFLGWPGLIAAVLVLVGLAIDSARARVPGSWLHPVLLGVLIMLVGNSFGAAGIVGQEFVIGIAALFVALRFVAAEAEPPL
jgi:uncharacterized membrane protein YwzB